MPRELRIVILSEDELASAAKEFLDDRGEIRRHHVVLSALVRSFGEPSLCVTVSAGETRRQRELRGAELAAAIIMFCMRRQIRLPARMQKTLRAVGRSMAMIFTCGISADEFFQTMIADQGARPAEQVPMSTAGRALPDEQVPSL